MSLEQTACEGKVKKIELTVKNGQQKYGLTFFSSFVLDLKAFERRLTEVIACLQPSTLRWRSELTLFREFFAAFLRPKTKSNCSL